MEKQGKKTQKIFIFLTDKKGKQSNEKETKTRILLLELKQENKIFKKKQNKGK